MDVELMLDNAAMCSQHKPLIDDDSVRECITLNIIDPMQERIEELEDALRDVIKWADAYPLDVFPEPDLVIARDALKAAGQTLDAVSASAMRHVLSTVRKDCVAAVGGE